MEGIEFEKEFYKPIISTIKVAKKSWAVKLVMKLFGARIKTERQANNVLIVFIIIFFALSIYNFTFSIGRDKPSQAEILKQEAGMEQMLKGVPIYH